MPLQRQQYRLIGLLGCAGEPMGQELFSGALPQCIVELTNLCLLAATDQHPPAIGETFAQKWAQGLIDPLAREMVKETSLTRRALAFILVMIRNQTVQGPHTPSGRAFGRIGTF